jgi:hypothetical protein
VRPAIKNIDLRKATVLSDAPAFRFQVVFQHFLLKAGLSCPTRHETRGNYERNGKYPGRNPRRFA